MNNSNGMQELSMDEMEWVSAAGIPDLPVQKGRQDADPQS